MSRKVSVQYLLLFSLDCLIEIKLHFLKIISKKKKRVNVRCVTKVIKGTSLFSLSADTAA